MNKQLLTQFISGFLEANGGFSVPFERRGGKERIVPHFYITQQSPIRGEISPMLLDCYHHFGEGHWLEDRRCSCYTLRISSVPTLLKKVRPHFYQFPLHGEKARDCKTFFQICQLLKGGGDRELVQSLALSMNRTRRGGSAPDQGALRRDLQAARTKRLATPLDPAYVSGLMQGDGGFYFSFRRSPARAQPSISLGQHALSLPLLWAVQGFFGCGTIDQVSPTHFRWNVVSLQDINARILPHFAQHPLRHEKLDTWHLFLRGLGICQDSSLSKGEHLVRLVGLLYGSNAGRGRLRKWEYLREIAGANP